MDRSMEEEAEVEPMNSTNSAMRPQVKRVR